MKKTRLTRKTNFEAILKNNKLFYHSIYLYSYKVWSTIIIHILIIILKNGEFEIWWWLVLKPYKIIIENENCIKVKVINVKGLNFV